MIKVYGYKKCSTVNKAIKYLNTYKEVEFFDFVDQQITKETLEDLVNLSAKSLDDFFNKNGQVFKQLKLKDRLASLSDEDKYELLLSDGKLIKRPIIKIDSSVFVGFNEKELDEYLK